MNGRQKGKFYPSLSVGFGVGQLAGIASGAIGKGVGDALQGTSLLEDALVGGLSGALSSSMSYTGNWAVMNAIGYKQDFNLTEFLIGTATGAGMGTLMGTLASKHLGEVMSGKENLDGSLTAYGQSEKTRINNERQAQYKQAKDIQERETLARKKQEDVAKKAAETKTSGTRVDKLVVKSVITGNYKGIYGTGMKGYQNITWTQDGKATHLYVDTIWAEPNGSTNDKYENPTRPGSSLLSPGISEKYPIYFNTGEGGTFVHYTQVSEGCFTIGTSSTASNIIEGIRNNFSNDIQTTVTHTVFDTNRKLWEKITQPLPYKTK